MQNWIWRARFACIGCVVCVCVCNCVRAWPTECVCECDAECLYEWWSQRAKQWRSKYYKPLFSVYLFFSHSRRISLRFFFFYLVEKHIYTGKLKIFQRCTFIYWFIFFLSLSCFISFCSHCEPLKLIIIFPGPENVLKWTFSIGMPISQSIIHPSLIFAKPKKNKMNQFFWGRLFFGGSTKKNQASTLAYQCVFGRR